MRFRSAWTGLLLLAVMAMACFGPACGAACAANIPCHDMPAMTDCVDMGPMASVQSTPTHAAVCAPDEAIVDRSDLDVHQVSFVAVVSPILLADASSRGVSSMVVRGLAKVPPRPIAVLRV